MIVRSPRPHGNFYVLDKRISEDQRLSWAARGLLVFLLGKPDHWQVSPAALVNEVSGSKKPTGRDATYALLQELIEAGYMRSEQAKTDSGTFGRVNYFVSEEPLTDFPEAAPHPGLPYPANPTQASIEEKQELKPSPSRARTRVRARVGVRKANGLIDGFEIGEELRREWTAAFPGVSIAHELQRAAAWLNANPSRGKSDYDRFLFNWLNRSSSRSQQHRVANHSAAAAIYDLTDGGFNAAHH